MLKILKKLKLDSVSTNSKIQKLELVSIYVLVNRDNIKYSTSKKIYKSLTNKKYEEDKSVTADKNIKLVFEIQNVIQKLTIKELLVSKVKEEGVADIIMDMEEKVKNYDTNRMYLEKHIDTLEELFDEKYDEDEQNKIFDVDYNGKHDFLGTSKILEIFPEFYNEESINNHLNLFLTTYEKYYNTDSVTVYHKYMSSYDQEPDYCNFGESLGHPGLVIGDTKLSMLGDLERNEDDSDPDTKIVSQALTTSENSRFIYLVIGDSNGYQVQVFKRDFNPNILMKLFCHTQDTRYLDLMDPKYIEFLFDTDLNHNDEITPEIGEVIQKYCVEKMLNGMLEVKKQKYMLYLYNDILPFTMYIVVKQYLSTCKNCLKRGEKLSQQLQTVYNYAHSIRYLLKDVVETNKEDKESIKGLLSEKYEHEEKYFKCKKTVETTFRPLGVDEWPTLEKVVEEYEKHFY